MLKTNVTRIAYSSDYKTSFICFSAQYVFFAGNVGDAKHSVILTLINRTVERSFKVKFDENSNFR